MTNFRQRLSTKAIIYQCFFNLHDCTFTCHTALFNIYILYNPTLSYYEWIKSSNGIETNNKNGSPLPDQVPSSGRCSRQRNSGCHHVNPVIGKRRKWNSQENKIVTEPEVREYRKRMLSLWLQKCMFWV